MHPSVRKRRKTTSRGPSKNHIDDILVAPKALNVFHEDSRSEDGQRDSERDGGGPGLLVEEGREEFALRL